MNSAISDVKTNNKSRVDVTTLEGLMDCGKVEVTNLHGCTNCRKAQATNLEGLMNSGISVYHASVLQL